MIMMLRSLKSLFKSTMKHNGQMNNTCTIYTYNQRYNNSTWNLEIWSIQSYYRVSNMDLGHFKGLLWLHFWCQTFSPVIFIVEKFVHFDIWNKKFFSLFQRVPLWFGSFFKFSANPNFEKWAKSWGDPLKFSKNFLFQISKCTNFSIMRMMEKNAWHQKWSHSSSLE